MADFDYSLQASGDDVARYTLEARRLRAEAVHAAVAKVGTKMRNLFETVRNAFRVPETEIL